MKTENERQARQDELEKILQRRLQLFYDSVELLGAEGEGAFCRGCLHQLREVLKCMDKILVEIDTAMESSKVPILDELEHLDHPNYKRRLKYEGCT